MLMLPTISDKSLKKKNFRNSMGKFFTNGSDVIYIPWNIHTLAARLWEEKYLSNLLLVVSTEDASLSFIPEIIHAQRRRFTQELCTNRPAPTYTVVKNECRVSQFPVCVCERIRGEAFALWFL